MGAERCSQSGHVNDGIFCGPRAEGLLARADTVGRARLLASVSLGSGSWLHALPCDNLGKLGRLGNDELRVKVGLPLGAPLVRTHRCVCGREVGDGHHGDGHHVCVVPVVTVATPSPMTSSSERFVPI